jgi:hypothetical protein
MLKKIPEKAEPETCPICGNRLKPVVYRGTGDNPFGDPDNSVLLGEELYTSELGWSYKW